MPSCACAMQEHYIRMELSRPHTLGVAFIIQWIIDIFGYFQYWIPELPFVHQPPRWRHTADDAEETHARKHTHEPHHMHWSSIWPPPDSSLFLSYFFRFCINSTRRHENVYSACIFLSLARSYKIYGWGNCSAGEHGGWGAYGMFLADECLTRCVSFLM